MTKQTCFQLFFVLLGLGFCRIGHAQISVGVRGGFLVTSVDKDPLSQGEPAPANIGGLQFAIPVEISIGEVFAVQPEIMYGTHGGIQKGSSTGTALGITTVSTFNYKYQISTLEIPLLAKVKFGPENIKFHVLAGPSFGFGVNGKFTQDNNIRSTLSNGTVVLDQTTNQDFKAKFVKDGFATTEVAADEFAVTKTNINVHFGAGLSVHLGGPSLFLDARYMLGLNDFRPEADGDTNDVSYKSKRIGVSVGVMFPL